MAETPNNLDPDLLPYRENATAQTTGGLPGTNKLWLAAWSGMVLRHYDQYNMFEGLVKHFTTPLPTVEFPISGTVSINPAWGAGVELLGNLGEYSSATVAITLDAREMVSYFELDKVDLSLAQWEYKNELARKCGIELTTARDKQLGVYLMLAATEAGFTADPRFGGSSTPFNDIQPPYVTTDLAHLGNMSGTATADQRTTAALQLLEAIEDTFVRWQNNNIPTDGPVYCAVTPRAFQDIRSLGIARDVSGLAGGAGRPLFGGVTDAGGLGSQLPVGMHKMTDYLEYQGCYIVKTNHLPIVDYAAAPIGQAKYNVDCGLDAVPTRALIWQPEAICSMRALSNRSWTFDDPRRNTTFAAFAMHQGTGILKPELARVVIGGTVASFDTRAEVRTALGSPAAQFVNTASGSYPY